MKRPCGRHSRRPRDPPFSPGDAILAAGRGIQCIGQRSVCLDFAYSSFFRCAHAATVLSTRESHIVTCNGRQGRASRHLNLPNTPRSGSVQRYASWIQALSATLTLGDAI